MKRIAIKLVVFLLLGAVVNVGVAWGCAAWVDISDPTGVRPESSRSELGAIVWQRPGVSRVFMWNLARLDDIQPDSALERRRRTLEIMADAVSLTSLSRARDQDHGQPASDAAWSIYLPRTFRSQMRPVIRDTRGWPLVSMGCTFATPSAPDGSAPVVEGGASLPPGAGGNHPWIQLRAVPFQPLWPGFLINTLFYAVILWLLWSTPFATRRLIRKRRGHCLKCAYDLGHAEHDVCPECGFNG